MKFGVRQFSLNKRISARTTGRITRSIKRKFVPAYGKYGMLKNPKKAIYNRIYHRTTVDSTKAWGVAFALVPAIILAPVLICYYLVKWAVLLIYNMFKWFILLYYYLFKYGYTYGKRACKLIVPHVTNYINNKRPKTI